MSASLEFVVRIIKAGQSNGGGGGGGEHIRYVINIIWKGAVQVQGQWYLSLY